MANPNTKIIIQEVNETLPQGAGVSSDIAYIPGLAVDTYTVGSEKEGDLQVFETIKNQPVLCYTVADLEAAFGPDPYVMKAEDVAGGDYAHTYEEGGLDRSYIYAKELLQAGMSVYYENIAPEGNVAVNIATVDEVYELIDQNAILLDDKNITDLQKVSTNNYKFVASKDRTAEQKYAFNFELPAPPKTTTVAGANTLAAGTVTVKVQIPQNMDKMTITPVAVNVWNNEDVGPFEISAVDGDCVTIKWTNASNNDFRKIFSLVISFRFSDETAVATVEFPVGIAVVEGTLGTGTEITNGRIQYLYEHLGDAFTRLEDKNEYTVKYITSGGYPTYYIGDSTLYTTMLTIAGSRGDAVALIDHLDMPEAPHGAGVTATGSIFNIVNTDPNHNLANANNAEYGAMFTPWAKYSFATVTDNADAPAWMPASFGYLMCMASAIATSPNWLAMAGVTRGAVPNLQSLHTDSILSNVVAEDYQPKYGTGKNVSINCITNIKPYGLCIWGNRTLQPMPEKGATAHNFLNTRNMCSDIKKVAYSTAKALMFEQDSDALWLRFKAGVSPLLDQLKSGYGLKDYKLIKGTTKYNGAALTKGEMAAVIKIIPMYAVEYFEITVVLADEDVQVS